MTICRLCSRSEGLRLRAGARAALAAAALLGAAPPLGAQDASDQKRLDEIARVAAQRFLAARAGEEQTRPTAPPRPRGCRST